MQRTARHATSATPALPMSMLGAFLLTQAASAATIRVAQDGSGASQTIQIGIDMATSGDTVLVESGTYHEVLDYKGRNIVVISTSGPAGTIVDGSGILDTVVKFKSGEGQTAVLSGLTIRGGSGLGASQGGSPRGGGIYVLNAEPTIVNCVITENRVGGRGFAGGMFLTTDLGLGTFVPKVVRCEISRNIGGGNGGGVVVGGTMLPLIQECDIHHNSVLDGDGRGVYSVTLPGGGIRLLNNKIHDNEVYDHGGGVYCGTLGLGEQVVEISSNTVWNNAAHAIPHTGETGGGIWIHEARGEISENTIVANRGEGGGEAQGGGIAAYGCPNLAIRKNIIALNPVGGGLFGRGAPPTTVVDNIFWSNGNKDVTGTCSGIDLTTANLRVDPLLCDLAQGNLAVASNSPALTYPGGVIGAFGVAGCVGVAVERTTWSRIKLGYR